MIAMEIVGADAVMQRFIAAPGKVRAAAKSTLDVWAAQLAAYIKSDKLSGSPLNRRSGTLSRSIFPRGGESSQGVWGGAGGGAGVPYAKIHEFGGLIPAHEVVARNAQALCFSADGIKRFAKSVHIPDVQMPERSYMRSSLREKAPEGIAELRQAVLAAILS
jgi:phage gpG-like protein